MDDRTHIEDNATPAATTADTLLKQHNADLLRQADQELLAGAEEEVRVLRARLGTMGYGAEPGLVTLADVEPERVEWLWPGRVPRGKLTLLEGDPGLGKSTLALDLAARITTGRPLPDHVPAPQGDVVLLTAEDGLADTVRPRLDALGGDPQRVRALQFVRETSGERAPVSLPEHVAVLRTVVEATRALLVIVDPFMAYLGAAINSFKDHDVRRSLAPLAELAEDTGAAVLLVRHLNKAAGGSALYRGGGSIGIGGAARSELLVARDPDDDSRRVLAPVKANLCAPAPSLSFSVEGAENGASRIVWHGESTHRADALVAIPADPEERGVRADAVTFLRDYLADGPRTVKEVTSNAREAGISERTLQRARQDLHVRTQRVGGVGGLGAWVLELPAAERVNGRGDAYEG